MLETTVRCLGCIPAEELKFVLTNLPGKASLNWLLGTSVFSILDHAPLPR